MEVFLDGGEVLRTGQDLVPEDDNESAGVRRVMRLVGS